MHRPGYNNNKTYPSFGVATIRGAHGNEGAVNGTNKDLLEGGSNRQTKGGKGSRADIK
jgi:hypothetical protein